MKGKAETSARQRRGFQGIHSVQDGDMGTVIRQPEKGCFGSSIHAVEQVEDAARGKITIERPTGYVPADLVADEIQRAVPQRRRALSLEFAAIAGEGRGRFPLHLSAAQTCAAIERAASFVEVPDQSRLVGEMRHLCDQAERREIDARNERVVLAEVAAVSAMINRHPVSCSILN